MEAGVMEEINYRSRLEVTPQWGPSLCNVALKVLEWIIKDCKFYFSLAKGKSDQAVNRTDNYLNAWEWKRQFLKSTKIIVSDKRKMLREI